MNRLVATVELTGYVALVLTSWSAIRGAWKHRDLRRLDILCVVLALLLASPLGTATFRGALGILPYAVPLAFPYLLLRLVQHFRTVPVTLASIAAVVPVLGAVVLGSTPLPWPEWQQYAMSTFVIGALIAITAAFGIEAGRSAGVTARRLAFAAMGTGFIVVIHTVVVSATRFSLDPESAAGLTRVLSAGSLLCYYLAFATPRRLRRSWQRQELARYLVATADREADERGAHAADDLLRAAQRGAAGSAVFVALRDTITSSEAVVRASSHPALVGVTLDPDAGPADMVYRAAESGIVPLTSLDGRLRDRLARTGTSVLLAPIASSSQRWGVVGVVQRRGSLFPPDDLRLLEQLAQYAGGMLDHGQLITDARERGRRAADRRLREAESRLSLMLDTIRDYAMLIVDDRGTIVNWPVGASAVFGHGPTDVLDTPAAPLFGMTNDAFLKTLSEAARAGSLAREHEGVRHDGTRFVATTHIRALEPGPEDLRGFVVVTKDISERRAMEDRLRQGQKMEALGRLAGGIAHDFNNLLTAILGYADWLAEELPAEDTERRDQVAEIQKAATRAAGLTRQLLAFSRHQIIQPVVLDIVHAVNEIMPMLRRVIGEHIEVANETVGQVPPVLADRNQIEQVILNLAVNARDAMPDGGTLLVRLSTEQLAAPNDAAGLGAGEWVRLDVLDTGIGMDAATKARIFEPFFTTKEFGRGTGLGLATVYGIVRQMSGVVHVDSTVGRGTTFSVYMRPTTLLSVEPGIVAEAAAPGGSETILLVEDERGVAKLLQQMLHRHGYQVVVAEDPEQALALAREYGTRIDLIVSDVVMPGGTGPELVKRLREDRPGLRAIFISGYADSVLSRDGLPPDAQFLQKPFPAIDLLIKVRQVLAGRTVAGLLVLAAGAACGGTEPAPAQDLTGAIEVAVTPARLNLLRHVVNANGAITPQPDAEWTIHAPEIAVIAEMPIAEGDPVAEGDLLVRFEVPSRTSSIQAAEYETAAWTTKLEAARTRLAELTSLLERGLTARVEVDTAKSTLAMAETTLAAAEATLAGLRKAEARDSVRARFPGILVRRWHYVGDLVMNTGNDPVLQVADPTRLQVRLDVQVSDAGKLMAGQRVTLMTAGTAPITTTVGAVLPAATADATMARVIVALPTPPTPPTPPTLKIGDPVLGEIVIAEVPEAMVVPTRAILRTTGTPYVLVAGADGRVVRRDLRLGVVTPELTQVLDGLELGEFVITSALAELTEGDLVRHNQ